MNSMEGGEWSFNQDLGGCLATWVTGLFSVSLESIVRKSNAGGLFLWECWGIQGMRLI